MQEFFRRGRCFIHFTARQLRNYTERGIAVGFLSVRIPHAGIYIFKSEASVCATQSAIAATFQRPVTSVNTLATPSSRPPARPARIPLGDTLCGYRTVVSVSSALQAVVATTTNSVSQGNCAYATTIIARSAIVASYIKTSCDFHKIKASDSRF